MEKIRYYLIILFILWLQNAWTQHNLTRYEYWYNNDYAERQTQELTPTPIHELNLINDVSELPDGLNVFNIRYMDDQGFYSSLVSKFFIKVAPPIVGGNKLVAYEYWYNDGFANKHTETLTANAYHTITASLDVDELPDGINVFNIRYKDERGFYGSIISKMFYKSAPPIVGGNNLTHFEYWYNDNIAGKHVETLTSAPGQHTVLSLDVEDLPVGLNVLSFRYKDERGFYGSIVNKMFFKKSKTEVVSINNKIIAYKYWFDTDIANANKVTLSNTSKIADLTSSIDMPYDMPGGNHDFYIQFQDSALVWSVIHKATFHKNYDPRGVITATPADGCQGSDILFSATCIDVDSIYWNFGDGSPIIGKKANETVSHSYDDINTYSVVATLKHVDSGYIATATTSVTVNQSYKPSSFAYSFNGTDEFIKGKNDASLQLNSGTIEAWIRTPDAGNDYRGIIVKHNAYGLFLLDNVLVAHDWVSSTFISTSVNLADNQWHHVALAFDNNVVGGSKIYIDGLPVKTFTYRISNQSVGVSVGSGSNYAIQLFKGNINNVRLWNTVRTDEQISANYQSILSGTESGLVMYWSFGMSSGSIVNDFSGHDNTGELVNMDNTNITAGHVGDISVAVCSNSLPYTFGTQSLTAGGSYIETFQTVHGCDSIVTLNLTVYPSYNTPVVPPENLIAYYPLDGNATDDSGNGHNGILHGATPTADRNGNENKALYFDGVNNYVDLGAWENGGPVSFTFWARWDAFGDWSRIFDFGNGAHSDNIVVCNSQTTNSLDCHILPGGGTVVNVRATNSIPTTPTWAHYAATVDGSGIMKIYKDGILLATNNNGIVPRVLTRTKQYLGRSNFSSNNFFKGAIDEFKMYNIALSAEQIKRDYTALTTLSICQGETPYMFGTQLLTANGTYTETLQTVHGCDSVVTLNLTIIEPSSIAAPTVSTPVYYSKDDVATALTATAESGYTLNWHTVETGGVASSTAPTPNTATVGITSYWVSQVNSIGCEGTRVKIEVFVKPLKPNGNQNQIYTGTKTLADLAIMGTNLQWYDAFTAGNMLASTTTLIDGATYYVTQTENELESDRLAVTVKRISDDTQTFCANNNPTIANLVTTPTTGYTAEWFASATGGEALFSTDDLSSGTYYVEQTAPTTIETLASSFHGPSAVAIQADGKIIIGDRINNAVKRMDADGSNIVTLRAGFNNPCGVAIQADGKIIIANHMGNTINRMDADGSNVINLGPGFSKPHGVAVQTDGKILIACYGGNTIKRMDADGSNVVSLGSGFNSPCGVAVQADGKILIADTYNSKIKRMDSDGSNIEILGSGFSGPCGVAVQADGKIVIADEGNKVVKRMDADGTNIVTLATGFSLPRGIATQTNGSIIIADYNNNNIKRYSEAFLSNRVAVQVVVNPTTTSTDIVTACDTFTWIDGNTYTASNNAATHTLTNAVGCDSIVTLNLTVNYSNTGIDTQTACDTFTWIDGNTYTASNNTATHTLTNAVGCDSIVTLNLTVNYSNTGIDAQTACDTFTWIDGNTYTASNNTATHTLTNAVGCDSIVTLNLTVNYSNTGIDTQTACDTFTWIDGNTYTSSNNTATHTLTNAVGCDSIVTLNLTVNYSNTGIDTQTACDTFTWIDGNTYTASNNTATHTLTNAVGCDSIVTLNLTVNYSTTGIDSQTACDTFTWIDGNTYTASNNTATHTLTNAVGCDSIVTLDLTVKYSTTGIDTQTACDTFTWIDGNTYTASNNTATHTLTNAVGCDSIVTLNLTVNYSNTGIDTQTACDTLTWIDGNTYTASNNTATHTLTNAVGCDSIVTLNLTVNYSTTGIDTQTACDSFTWIDGNTYTASNNAATHTLTNAVGCDSIVTLNLTVNYSNTGIDTQTACDTFTWIDGNTYTASNNTATHTLTNAVGCDSIVTLNLTVYPTYNNSGNAISLNGVNEYVKGTNDVSLHLNKGTIEAWIKTSGCDNLFNGIIAKRGAYGIFLKGNKLSVFDWSTGQDFTTNINLADNQWHHVALSFDGGVANGSKLYCDGQLIQTLTMSINNQYENILVGNGSISQSDQLFKGEIDNAKVWKTILSDQEIYESYAGQSISSENLVMYWEFNEISSTTVNDLSGKGNNGLLINMDINNYTSGAVPAENIAICDSQTPYTFGTQQLTVTGFYTETFQTIHGCDSIVTLSLTVNSSYNLSSDLTLCASELPHMFGNQSLTASGVYTEVFQSINGCDSTVNLTFTVLPLPESNQTVEICQGQTYTFGMQTLTTSGNYSHTVIGGGANGCDSIANLTLIVNPAGTSYESVSVCENTLPYTFGTQTLNASGEFTETFQTSANCDSIVVLTFTVLQIPESTQTAEICQGENYIFGSQTLNISGNYIETIVGGAANGCDSIANLTLTVHPTYNLNENVAVCQNQVPYTFGNQSLTASGVYTEVFPSINGCDSTVNLTFTVLPLPESNQTVEICQGQTYTFGMQTFTTSGNYSHTVIGGGANGCDSIANLTLIVNPAGTSYESVSVCENTLPYTFGTQILNASGVFTETFQTSANCDSIVVLTFTVLQIPESLQIVDICSGESYQFGTQTLTTSGNYTQTIVGGAANGCDSIANLTLTVHPKYNINTSLTICKNETPFAFGNQNLTVSGVYTEHFQSVNNCDSTVTLTLTVNPSYIYPQYVSVCKNELPYYYDNQMLMATGFYNFYFTTTQGCDSTIILHFTVNPTYEQTQSVTVCSNELPYQFGSQLLTSAGTYTEIFQTVEGCDSTVNLTLTVNPSYNRNENIELCKEDLPYLFGNIEITQSGSYVYNFGSVNGCDSIVNLKANVIKIDTAVSVQDAVLYAVTQANASYQWVDCNQQNQPIAGATGAIFMPTKNGTYAVIISIGQCQDISRCVEVTDVSVTENEFQQNILVYPNPTDGDLEINLHKPFDKVYMTIFTVDGKLLDENEYKNTQIIRYTLKAPKGVYILHLRTKEAKAVFRIVRN